MSTLTLDTIAPEHPGLSLRQALVASARELQPRLERNATRTEADRRVAEENLTAIRSADLLKIAVPRCFGGPETDIRNLVQTSRSRAVGSAERWLGSRARRNPVRQCHWYANREKGLGRLRREW